MESTSHVNQMHYNIFLPVNQSLNPIRKNTRAIWRHPQIPHTLLEHSVLKCLSTMGVPSHCIHYFTFLQCNVETASLFCKVDRCSFYKNINLQYITLNNFNLYIFFPPIIGDTRQFVQIRKKNPSGCLHLDYYSREPTRTAGMGRKSEKV